MKTTHIPASTFKTNVWSGGKTTELFIYPPTTKYAQRDFDFRLSTATVEVENSDFTPLPGYRRKLMVLDGATKLMHENQHEILLNKLDVDTFLGDWKTTSAGKCTDFNVMTAGALKSTLSALRTEKNNATIYQTHKNCTWLFIYVFAGEIIINHQKTSATKGDLLVLENPPQGPVKLLSIKDSAVVFTEIFLG